VQPPKSWKHHTCLRQFTDTHNCAKRRAGNGTDGYCALTCGVCTPCVMANGSNAVPEEERVDPAAISEAWSRRTRKPAAPLRSTADEEYFFL